MSLTRHPPFQDDYTEEQLEQFKAVFEACDSNGNGVLTIDDLGGAL